MQTLIIASFQKMMLLVWVYTVCDFTSLGVFRVLQANYCLLFIHALYVFVQNCLLLLTYQSSGDWAQLLLNSSRDPSQFKKFKSRSFTLFFLNDTAL